MGNRADLSELEGVIIGRDVLDRYRDLGGELSLYGTIKILFPDTSGWGPGERTRGRPGALVISYPPRAW